ncbi:MAG: TolC family protein, partial [Sphaerochaeta sp.]|nr:TolC family protein [Sphaerochaeta sp.]
QVTLENLQQDIALAENELQQGIHAAKSEVKTLYQNLMQLEAQLQYLFEYREASEVTFAYSQAAYEAGEITYLELMESEQHMQNARLSILQQQVTYTVSLYELAYLLETDVKTIINA